MYINEIHIHAVSELFFTSIDRRVPDISFYNLINVIDYNKWSEKN